MLTSSDIFFELKYSTLVSDLYGLINVPMVKHCVITKGPLYGVSYFYAVWLLRMNLSLTL